MVRRHHAGAGRRHAGLRHPRATGWHHGDRHLRFPDNFGECGEDGVCLIIFEDYEDPNPPARIYAAASGTVTLEAPVGLGSAAGVLENVELVEVTLDDKHLDFSEVAGGVCLQIITSSFDVTTEM